MRIEFPTTTDVRFHHLPDGVRWELLAPAITLVNPHAEDQRIIRVPPGFMTDFASVPRLPFVYLAYGNKAHLPALPHDWLYTVGGNEQDREFADDVFLHGMLATLVADGANSLTEADAHTMYQAVRQFGGSHFNYR